MRGTSILPSALLKLLSDHTVLNFIWKSSLALIRLSRCFSRAILLDTKTFSRRYVMQ